MRKIYSIFCIFIISFAAACIQQHEHYTAELKLNPEFLESGKPAELTFQIKNPQGKNVSDLEIIHEKPLHLFIVSEDLSQYFHEHPTKQNDGTYKLPITFPNGGNFKVFIDFKPKDDEQTVESFDLQVKGKELEKVSLVPDEKFEKTVEGLLVKMNPKSKLIKQTDLMLEFQVFDAETKKPVTDLQNYLGEKAHFVIIRKGLGRFVHAHPMSGGKLLNMNSNHDMNTMKMEMPDEKQATKIMAMTNFPNSGIYKIFAQFKRNDKIITVPFVFEVKN